ncbi:hypothetical protein [Leptospira phage LE3]|uniref:Uncharacterized protein n=2 Tax=Nylescharonvirus TaxID=2843431 RepID=A0A343LEH0_9CAUD|nr:hypothetical protein HWB33_gp69 [Leptospira phage LE3]YP_009835542.1 hypothetical protein HWB34_gp67 [Leptospira phage LE4]ATN95015.1 hypothetical protein [Leptospira phage LE3]ATN95080.1 hypothetical protein [Leptospira phage LE4]
MIEMPGYIFILMMMIFWSLGYLMGKRSAKKRPAVHNKSSVR